MLLILLKGNNTKRWSGNCELAIDCEAVTITDASCVADSLLISIDCEAAVITDVTVQAETYAVSIDCVAEVVTDASCVADDLSVVCIDCEAEVTTDTSCTVDESLFWIDVQGLIVTTRVSASSSYLRHAQRTVVEDEDRIESEEIPSILRYERA